MTAAGPRWLWRRTRHWFYLRHTYVQLETDIAAVDTAPVVSNGIEYRCCELAEVISQLEPSAARRLQPLWDACRPDALRCCAAFSRGRLVAMSCASLAEYRYPLTRVTVRLKPGQALIFSSYTLPAYRGRGIMTALRDHAFHRLTELGYRSLVAVVERENRSSLRMHQRMGSRVLGYVHVRKVLWWRRSWSRPAAGESVRDVVASTPLPAGRSTG